VPRALQAFVHLENRTLGTLTISLRPATSSQSPSKPMSRFTRSRFGCAGDLQPKQGNVAVCPVLGRPSLLAPFTADSRLLVHQTHLRMITSPRWYVKMRLDSLSTMTRSRTACDESASIGTAGSPRFVCKHDAERQTNVTAEPYPGSGRAAWSSH